jgi:DNA-binding NtrC family response regulator
MNSVLIVDDDVKYARFVTSTVRDLAPCTTAPSVGMARPNLSSGKILLVLVTSGFLSGESSLDLVHEIAETTPSLPLSIVTPGPDRDVVTLADRVGARLLWKPPDPQDIVRHVARALARSANTNPRLETVLELEVRRANLDPLSARLAHLAVVERMTSSEIVAREADPAPTTRWRIKRLLKKTRDETLVALRLRLLEESLAASRGMFR